MVAFILMAFIASLPDLFIGISSIFHGIPEASFAEITGANIINLTLAIGLAVLFLGGSLEVEKKIIKKDAVFTAISALLPIILILDGELSRIDGIILLLGFAIYLSWLFSQKDRFHRIYNNTDQGIKQFLKDILLFLGSVALLILGAELMIGLIVIFAQTFNISTTLIGVIVIGAGTALPETYFVVRAALHGRREMILGNLMGSVVITSLLILGVVALIYPIKIADFTPYFIARIFLMISAISFMVFIRTHEKITKKEALLLIFIYLAFVAAEILLR